MSLETQLKSLEERLLKPEIRRDPKALSRLLADDFREFGSSGRVFNNAGIIADLQQERYTPPELTEFAAMLLAPEVALVTYRTSRAQASALRSSIWVYREERWQIVFHQGTKAVV